MSFTRRSLLGTAAAGVLLGTGAVRAETQRVLFGQVAASTGQLAPLGRGMQAGIEAAFAEANRRGGAGGTKVELTAVDDGDHTERAAVATRDMITGRRVFALIGAVGTPTSLAGYAVAARAGVPFLGAATGTPALRVPSATDAINIRASYTQERAFMLDRLQKDLGIRRIGVLYRIDAPSLADLQGPLAQRGMTIVAAAGFQRGVESLAEAVATIQSGDPEAVLSLGPTRQTAAFAREMRKAGFNGPLMHPAWTEGEDVADAARQGMRDIYFTEVVPNPFGAAAGRYRAALAASDPTATPSYASMEGYLAGRLAIEALGRIKGPKTRQAFMQAILNSGPFDLDGYVLQFGAGRNQGSDRVALITIGPDGLPRPVGSLSSRV